MLKKFIYKNHLIKINLIKLLFKIKIKKNKKSNKSITIKNIYDFTIQSATEVTRGAIVLHLTVYPSPSIHPFAA